mgnify:CR=1 FL=1
MMISSKLSIAHLSQCSRVAAQIARLPGVATPDWCEVAGRTLLRICPDSIVSVTIAEGPGPGNGRGDSLSILATGAASDSQTMASHRIHPDSATDLGWTLSEAPHVGPAGAHPRVAKLRDLPSWSRWPVTPSGKRWAKLGIRELLCADIALPDGPDGRELLVEVGSGNAMQRFERGEAEMVSAVLPVLAERAAMAFGKDFTQTLTSREQLILVELVSGASVREIAERIDRSPHTVHDHVKSLHRKLNASSRGELVSRYLGFHASSPAAARPDAKDEPEIQTRKARPISVAHA